MTVKLLSNFISAVKI